ncbi:DHA2 family efflux MFS transporter permease subunit [Actinomycetospora cinnamomea]|uniref:EmrB/QacA subfamily drug resistance transporter n=1 Tax=Actinomycetospora cinnamomea TaxID=663609 RepID=A0A2U1F8D3_9PSEU|nr:MFS transporter [Actinomycetospora cinnamomea]PVZ08442.1 EmrB/QacA subfamily drug resistance transporter [Actinomycetospora cinnamomea]
MRTEGRTGLVLLASCLAQFMVVLDVSIVNVALPAMRTALGFDAEGLAWVVNAYTLAFAGFLLLGGRAADLFGRRRVFLVGLGLFGLASLIGGLANDPALLLAARAVQGLGGAVLSPASLAILQTTYPEGASRSRAFGWWSAVGGIGGATGGLAGGVLVGLLSWRWIFLVNVPVVVLTAVLTVAVVRESRAAGRPGLDVTGAVLVTAGLVALVYGVVSTETEPWTSVPVLGSLVAAAVLLTAFVLVQRRVRDPLVPLSVFRIRSVTTANVVILLVSSAMFSMWFFVSLHMQGVLGFDALTAGLAFLPQSGSVVIGSQISSRLLPRVGARALLVGGAALTAAGFAWFAFLTPTTSWVAGVLGPGIAVSLGMGLVFPAVTTAATSGVDGGLAGLVSGLVTTSRQIGGAIGLSVLSTLAVARATSVGASGAPAPAASTAGTTAAFTVAAVVVGVAALVALLVPAPARRGSPEPARV